MNNIELEKYFQNITFQKWLNENKYLHFEESICDVLGIFCMPDLIEKTIEDIYSYVEQYKIINMKEKLMKNFYYLKQNYGI